MAAATHPISLPLVPQSLPVDQVSQFELAAILSLRLRSAQLESEIKKAEDSLIARLRAGVVVESGDHEAEVRRSLRRAPSWKNVTKRLARRFGLDADAFVSNVIARTRPSESFSIEID
jgi:hypothetical protein